MKSRAGEMQRLRRRMARQGENRLADHELLALLLGGQPGQVATAKAIGLIESAGGLQNLARRSAVDLSNTPGIGPAGAGRLIAALELGRRLAVQPPPKSQSIQSSADVALWFRCRLQDLSRETIHALMLDGKNRPVHHLCLAEGSWTSCHLDPKLLFSACLRHRAAAVILVHNHPSGDPHPSRDDLALTERMGRAARVVGVKLLDHLIVGREGVFSMADDGLL